MQGVEAASAPAILAARAAADPEGVWLLFPRGLDWGWLSWRQVADQMARAAVALGESDGGATPGTAERCAFVDGSRPDAVAADLAIFAAGRTAVPLPPEATAPADLAAALAGGGCRAVLAPPGELVELPASVTRHELPPPRSRLERWVAARLPSSAAAPVALRDGAVTRLVDAAALVAGAAELSTALPPPAGRAVLASAEPVGTPAGRLLLAWTLGTSAAWVLSPRREELVADVLWARPMVVAARREERRALLHEIPEDGRRRWSRLYAVVTLDGAADDEERGAWLRRGVQVAALPSIPASPQPDEGSAADPGALPASG